MKSAGVLHEGAGDDRPVNSLFAHLAHQLSQPDRRPQVEVQGQLAGRAGQIDQHHALAALGQPDAEIRHHGGTADSPLKPYTTTTGAWIVGAGAGATVPSGDPFERSPSSSTSGASCRASACRCTVSRSGAFGALAR